MKFFTCLLALLAFASLVSARGKVFKGYNAPENLFPYVAFLGVRFKAGEVRCTGSLLSNTWILSAAHCMYTKIDNAKQEKATFVNVGLGGATIYTMETVRNTSTWIVHPNYNSVNLDNDLVLIKIPYVPYSNRIKNIPLPSKLAAEDEKSIWYPLAKLNIDQSSVAGVGWGYTSNAEIPTKILQYTNFTTISNAECRMKVRHRITDQHICVNTGASSLCHGDSGGPMVCFVNGKLIQGGVASFRTANDSCSSGSEVVYMRITACLGWIYNVTGLPFY